MVSQKCDPKNYRVERHISRLSLIVSEETGPKSHTFKNSIRRPAPAETIRDSICWYFQGSLMRKPRESVVSELGMHAIEYKRKVACFVGANW